MYILLAISILCFFALLLATAAVTRHVRTRRLPGGSQPDFAQHLFAAAKDHDSLTPHVRQQQSVKELRFDNVIEQRAPANPDQHAQSINLIKAPLARKDLLDAIRYSLATRPPPPF